MDANQCRKGFRFEWDRHGPTLRVWLDRDGDRWELFRVATRCGAVYLGAASLGVSGYRFGAVRPTAYRIVDEFERRISPVDTGL